MGAAGFLGPRNFVKVHEGPLVSGRFFFSWGEGASPKYNQSRYEQIALIITYFPPMYKKTASKPEGQVLIKKLLSWM